MHQQHNGTRPCRDPRMERQGHAVPAPVIQRFLEDVASAVSQEKEWNSTLPGTNVTRGTWPWKTIFPRLSSRKSTAQKNKINSQMFVLLGISWSVFLLSLPRAHHCPPKRRAFQLGSPSRMDLAELSSE